MLRNAWLVVSTSAHEGLALNFLEAFWFSTPVVATTDPEGVISKFGAVIRSEGEDPTGMWTDTRLSSLFLLFPLSLLSPRSVIDNHISIFILGWNLMPALVNAVSDLLRDTKHRRELGQAAWKWVRDTHTSHHFLAKFRPILRDFGIPVIEPPSLLVPSIPVILRHPPKKK